MAQTPHKGNRKGSGKKAGKPFSKKNNTAATAKAKVDQHIKNPEAGMRLNKYIANSGICSRRDADIYISSGNVTVNGNVITEMGYKVKPTDEVKFDGRKINPEPKEYVLLNKPKGFYVTGSLEKNNRTVLDLIAKASRAKLDPVGKLDTSTMGLLLFTNDGTMAKNLGSSKKLIRQIYHVELDKQLDMMHLLQIREGVALEDGKVIVDEVSYVENQPKKHVGLELKSCKPHIVQRLFKKLGYNIVKLDRVVYGGLTKKDLPRGRYRHLTKQEVINLGML